MRSTILKPRWTDRRLNLLQHEYGVAVDEECGDFSPVGAEVRVWIEDQRSRGFGRVMPLEKLRRWVEWNWFGAYTIRERRQVKHAAIARIAELLNDSRNGLEVVPLKHRCADCGGAA